MEFKVPNSIKTEHNELHNELVEANKVHGTVGEAANRVSKLLHPHFLKEEEHALLTQSLFILSGCPNTWVHGRRLSMSMKENYEKKPQAQLDEWGAELDKLKAKADKAEADAQLECYKQIEELRSMQEAASNRIAELKEAGDDAWEDLKAGIESAWDSLDNELKSATSRFK